MSWQLSPHCYVDLYLDVLAFSFDRTELYSSHTFETWDRITSPNVIAIRTETTDLTTIDRIGFDFNGLSGLSVANRSWVRVGFNYTF